MSKRSIIRMVAMLEHTGWIEVARAGHHRPNQFVLLSGDRGDKVLSPLRGDKVLSPQSTSEVTNSKVRGDRIGESEVTHAVTHKAKRKAKRKAEESDSPPADVSRDVKKATRGEDRTRKKVEAVLVEKFEVFRAAFPHWQQNGMEAARAEFAAAVKRGTDPNVIIGRARSYAISEFARIEGGGAPRFTKQPNNWLRERRYEDPVPDGAIIDQGGAIVGFAQGEQAPRRSGFPAIADQLIAEHEAEFGDAPWPTYGGKS
jgi:hypothetical protein